MTEPLTIESATADLLGEALLQQLRQADPGDQPLAERLDAWLLRRQHHQQSRHAVDPTVAPTPSAGAATTVSR